jgi:beta-xylosidase
MSKRFIHIALLLMSANLQGQNGVMVSVPQSNVSSYSNPVIHADYSDPDAVRVGDDYYMVSSSFNAVPGLPILHSRDLVNWSLIGYALSAQHPLEHFSSVQHGGGVWAPSIRFHKNEFYIYYPDPDFGIYLIKSKNIRGPWSQPVLVEAGKGLIDPCPLWDDNGKVYLVHAFAGSRAGIKSIIVVREMNQEGTRFISAPVLVYDGHEKDPTVEGPKFYKRNGYYYIFAPAGGVSTGWQIVLRSKHVYGPYERRIVMHQGKTDINGPHQGAWVESKAGDWFLHFQDKEEYGRIVHLQPLTWKNDWPVIGADADGDGTGEPVSTYKRPFGTTKNETAGYVDEFNGSNIPLQWQWQANPQSLWAIPIPSQGKLRLNSVLLPANAKNFWSASNLLLQKLPAAEFSAEVVLKFSAKTNGERVGLMVMGLDYAYLALEKRKDAIVLIYVECREADKDKPEQVKEITTITADEIRLLAWMNKEGEVVFGYKDKSGVVNKVPGSFKARPGKWVGAKIGVFCTRVEKTNDGGYADLDYFKIENLK